MLWDKKESWPESGNLHLDNFHYGRIVKDAPGGVKDRLEWLDRQPKEEFNSQPYEQLAKVYREAGREEDARKVLYEKNRHRAECVSQKVIASRWPDRAWLTLTGLVVGYGYRELHEGPYRIIYQILGQDVFMHCVLDARRELQELLQTRLLR